VSEGFATEIEVADSTASTDRAELEARLYAFNVERTGFRDGRTLSCFLRDPSGELVAGIDGFTWGGYARIELLWVDASARGQGLGRRLVNAVEHEAAERGCTTIVLASHDFQAPDFYAKLGYELVGETADTPRGHRELTFRKQLGGG